jgi:hypothetical protein
VNWIFWIGGLLLFGVAAYSVWRAFRSPKFIARLTKFASRQAWKAIKPTITEPLPPDQLEARQKAYRRGDDGWLRKRQGSLKD